MKGQVPTPLVQSVFAIFIILIGGTLTLNIMKENSDDYVERQKLEDAQSKISVLESTIEDKKDRIASLESKNNNLESLLEGWKENYTELEQRNKKLLEKINQTEHQQSKECSIFPPINIEYPWGMSITGILAFIIGVIVKTFKPSLFGITGKFGLMSEKSKKIESDKNDEESGD